MIGVFPALYVGYKIVKRTKILSPEEVDLHKDLEEIEEHERTYVAPIVTYAPPSFLSQYTLLLIS